MLKHITICVILPNFASAVKIPTAPVPKLEDLARRENKAKEELERLRQQVIEWYRNDEASLVKLEETSRAVEELARKFRGEAEYYPNGNLKLVRRGDGTLKTVYHESKNGAEWILYDETGTKKQYSFFKNGNLKATYHENGCVATEHYESSGKPKRDFDQDGVMTVSYDEKTGKARKMKPGTLRFQQMSLEEKFKWIQADRQAAAAAAAAAPEVVPCPFLELEELEQNFDCKFHDGLKGSCNSTGCRSKIS